ncbi:hypothetical protein BC936DRAFT_150066 [Jimgerdemannia flammicorona]|uniref:Uncharacterized protein n=2 Tax=Jimgerdemannia flammicorona TaxID=994334 RepID=A0A433DMY7_9FUNG|nr:hypothetical protein BC936DRAFT_150066 [Jimgerdemannia flammicorona]RUS34916.1 hypothetical protein BC938DRAFT_477830 [Jimgerdemannia flammicorona]
MSDNEETDSPSERLKRSLPEDDDGHSDSDSDDRHARFKRQATGGNGPNDNGPSGVESSNGGGASTLNVGDGVSSSVLPMERDGTDDAQGTVEGGDGAGGDGSVTGGSVKSSTAPSISIRSLVTTKEAGVIIGKGGKNVSDIRDKSGARVTISEMVQGAYERILTVTGPLDAVAKAYALVARKILDENLENEDPTNGTRILSIRLLVPDARMGSVIGKGGVKIKEIQEASGARLNASEDRLPMSTERSISITGVPDSIHIACYKVGEILQEHMERASGTIPYKPQARFAYPPNAGSPPGGPGGVPGAGPGPGGNAPPFFYNPPPPTYGGPPGGRGAGDFGPGVGGGPGGPGGGNPPPPGSQAQQIFIPNDMVGCIIGKGGAKINEIRHLSGSHIKIAEPHGNTNERLVTITGTPESNQMALYLLYSRLESEKGRMSAH